jgi:hypothetical protein
MGSSETVCSMHACLRRHISCMHTVVKSSWLLPHCPQEGAMPLQSPSASCLPPPFAIPHWSAHTSSAFKISSFAFRNPFCHNSKQCFHRMNVSNRVAGPGLRSRSSLAGPWGTREGRGSYGLAFQIGVSLAALGLSDWDCVHQYVLPEGGAMSPAARALRSAPLLKKPLLLSRPATAVAGESVATAVTDETLRALCLSHVAAWCRMDSVDGIKGSTVRPSGHGAHLLPTFDGHGLP